MPRPTPRYSWKTPRRKLPSRKRRRPNFWLSASKKKRNISAWPTNSEPDRAIPPFLDNAQRFQKHPFHTVVSCPIAGAGGYGGAMGPAQFIPSTWKLLANRIKDALGYEGNPWVPRDAFMASALFLSDLG